VPHHTRLGEPLVKLPLWTKRVTASRHKLFKVFLLVHARWRCRTFSGALKYGRSCARQEAGLTTADLALTCSPVTDPTWSSHSWVSICAFTLSYHVGYMASAKEDLSVPGSPRVQES
jgi:hypothetical protein